MLRIIGCLTVDHDLHLVLLAAALCSFGMVASLVVSSRVLRGGAPALWMPLLAVCAGSTVWATHFLAMLAYKTALPMTYDVSLTAGSYLVGVVVMGVGFAVALQKHAQPPAALF